MVPGIVSLVLFGLRPAIDFTGGTLLELRFEQEIDPSRQEEVKKIVEQQEVDVSSVQSSGEKTVLIRSKPVDSDKVIEIKEKLGEQFGGAPEEVRVETVGPTLGKELLVKTLTALALAASFILAYVAWQFRDKRFGITAIFAMLHDSLILLGSFSLLGHFFWCRGSILSLSPLS